MKLFNLSQIQPEEKFLWDWGTPKLFFEKDGKQLKIAFLIALFFHGIPLGYFWQRQSSKSEFELVTTLQNVELIEPEKPVITPLNVEEPKSALEFLKMALPIFKKNPQTLREIPSTQKISEPQIKEVERLVEKKMNEIPKSPEIKLGNSQRSSLPDMAELALQTKKQESSRELNPRIQLEEVGKKAVPPMAQTPQIVLGASESKEKIVELSKIPRKEPSFTTQKQEALVEKTFVNPQKPFIAPQIGFSKKGADLKIIAQEKPQVPAKLESTVIEKKEIKKLEISKEKVKITGPLSSRKIIKSVLPEYPNWAKSKNIEADVAVRFTVSKEGDVRKNMVIERTSGYPELDRLVLEALKNWKFSSLDKTREDQWGTITFRFRLD
ncbi:MAG: TonB family protein [Elusimicrobia bacterium]|nr:TonB family protein [Elusimicrobiota bacterium]